MAQPYVGEIRLVGFNFAPQGWAFCDGSLLSISQNIVLFDLIGTTYGGDGQQTFALPNLLGRVPVHTGTDTQGIPYVIGQLDGNEAVTLISNMLPAHSHPLQVNSGIGTSNAPAGKYLASTPLALGNMYVSPTAPSSMADQTTVAGGSQAHDNMQPFLALNYILSLFGIFPSQN